ncbi:hypothetical protein CW713_12125 [Methanophagales archaeon]|nr:MAG: hypothetical protein CW713_12125 [Methanophagales archaeon]
MDKGFCDQLATKEREKIWRAKIYKSNGGEGPTGVADEPRKTKIETHHHINFKYSGNKDRL